MEKDFAAYVDHVEKAIVQVIKHEHPDWAQDNGTGPKCYEYYKKQVKG